MKNTEEILREIYDLSKESGGQERIRQKLETIFDTNDWISDLEVGDIVQNQKSGNSYIVVRNDGDTVTASRTLTITNPKEWIKW